MSNFHTLLFLFISLSSTLLPSKALTTPPHNLPSSTTTTATTTNTTTTNTTTTNTTTTTTPSPLQDDYYNDFECERCDDLFCHSSGRCCLSGKFKFCMCLSSYVGEHCEWYVPEESKYDKMKLTLVTSLTTLFIIILAFILLLFVIFYALKKGKQHHANSFNNNNNNYDTLDRELLYVQGEMHKLEGKDKYCGMKRLSKMIEATARAALLTYPELVAPLEERLDQAPSHRASKITRRLSDPCLLAGNKEDPFRVERTTAVLFYQKPGRVKMVKRDLRKLLSH